MMTTPKTTPMLPGFTALMAAEANLSYAIAQDWPERRIAHLRDNVARELAAEKAA